MKLSLKRSLWPRGESSCVWWLPPMTSMSNPCQVIVTKKKKERKKPEVTLSNRKQNKIKSVMENVNTGHRWSRPSLWNVHAESQHGNLCLASSAEPEAAPSGPCSADWPGVELGRLPTASAPGASGSLFLGHRQHWRRNGPMWLLKVPSTEKAGVLIW